MKVLKLINSGSQKLKANNINSYRIDSEILLSKVLETKREKLLTNLEQIINSRKISEFNNLIERRCLNEPIAYITKKKEFWSKNFLVNKDTLIPRPETELMIDKLVKIFKNKDIFILDIGTGTGCILISLLHELKNSSGIGIDISKNALNVAQKNAQYHGILKKVKFLNKSFTQLFNKKFDLVVSNPPYIERRDIKKLDDDIKKYEPIIALDGGNDGLDVIKKVIYKAKDILKLNGILSLEIGKGQFKQVSRILNYNDLRVEHIIKDYKENIRCLISRLIK